MKGFTMQAFQRTWQSSPTGSSTAMRSALCRSAGKHLQGLKLLADLPSQLRMPSTGISDRLHAFLMFDPVNENHEHCSLLMLVSMQDMLAAMF